MFDLLKLLPTLDGFVSAAVLAAQQPIKNKLLP